MTLSYSSLTFSYMSMIVCFILAAALLVNLFDTKCDVPNLNGDNYKEWKYWILLQLGCMDFDYAIQKFEPPAVNPTSIKAQIAEHE